MKKYKIYSKPALLTFFCAFGLSTFSFQSLPIVEDYVFTHQSETKEISIKKSEKYIFFSINETVDSDQAIFKIEDQNKKVFFNNEIEVLSGLVFKRILLESMPSGNYIATLTAQGDVFQIEFSI